MPIHAAMQQRPMVIIGRFSRVAAGIILRPQKQKAPGQAQGFNEVPTAKLLFVAVTNEVGPSPLNLQQGLAGGIKSLQRLGRRANLGGEIIL